MLEPLLWNAYLVEIGRRRVGECPPSHWEPSGDVQPKTDPALTLLRQSRRRPRRSWKLLLIEDANPTWSDLYARLNGLPRRLTIWVPAFAGMSGARSYVSFRPLKHWRATTLSGLSA